MRIGRQALEAGEPAGEPAGPVHGPDVIGIGERDLRRAHRRRSQELRALAVRGRTAGKRAREQQPRRAHFDTPHCTSSPRPAMVPSFVARPESAEVERAEMTKVSDLNNGATEITEGTERAMEREPWTGGMERAGTLRHHGAFALGRPSAGRDEDPRDPDSQALRPSDVLAN